MSFTFFHRPKPKGFGYKPQFYNPEEEERKSKYRSEADDFEARLHKSWDRKRTRKTKNQFPFRAIIWSVAIVLVLLYLYYAFFMKK